MEINIGERAFQHVNCETLTIPANVTVGLEAFKGCYNLKHLTLEEGCKLDATGQFLSCYSLEEVTIPTSLTSLPGNTFADCSSLTSINLGTGLKQITDGTTFSNATKLSDLYIPNNVTSIAHTTFSGIDTKPWNLSIDMETIPDEHYNVYGSLTNLSTLTLLSNVKQLNRTAFWAPESTNANNVLTSINIPDNVEYVGDGAFEHYKALKEVTFGSGLTSLVKWAFADCPNVTKIVFNSSKGLDGFDNNTFKNSASVSCLEFNNVSNISIGSNILKGKSQLKRLILDGVSGLGTSAFEGATLLTSLQLPNSLTSIAEKTFQGCTGLTALTADCPIIGQSMFNNCSGLRNVVLTENVTTITRWAFENNTSLATLSLPSSLTAIGTPENDVFKGVPKTCKVTYNGTKEQFTSLLNPQNCGFASETVIKCSNGDLTL